MFILIPLIIYLILSILFVYWLENEFVVFDIILTWAMMSFVITMLGWTIIPDKYLEEASAPEKVEIVALNDTDSYVGSFLSVKNEIKYRFMYESTEGYVQYTVPANKAYIKYLEKNEHPYVLKTAGYQDFKLPWKIFFISPKSVTPKYIFYIPKGSIKEEFVVDLE